MYHAEKLTNMSIEAAEQWNLVSVKLTCCNVISVTGKILKTPHSTPETLQKDDTQHHKFQTESCITEHP